MQFLSRAKKRKREEGYHRIVTDPPPGTNGTNGTNGTDGTDGTDGKLHPISPIRPISPIGPRGENDRLHRILGVYESLFEVEK